MLSPMPMDSVTAVNQAVPSATSCFSLFGKIRFYGFRLTPILAGKRSTMSTWGILGWHHSEHLPDILK